MEILATLHQWRIARLVDGLHFAQDLAVPPPLVDIGLHTNYHHRPRRRWPRRGRSRYMRPNRRGRRRRVREDQINSKHGYTVIRRWTSLLSPAFDKFGSITHPNIFCNNCRRPISGVRYQVVTCETVTCESCQNMVVSTGTSCADLALNHMLLT